MGLCPGSSSRHLLLVYPLWVPPQLVSCPAKGGTCNPDHEEVWGRIYRVFIAKSFSVSRAGKGLCCAVSNICEQFRTRATQCLWPVEMTLSGDRKVGIVPNASVARNAHQDRLEKIAALYVPLPTADAMFAPAVPSVVSLYENPRSSHFSDGAFFLVPHNCECNSSSCQSSWFSAPPWSPPAIGGTTSISTPMGRGSACSCGHPAGDEVQSNLLLTWLR